MENENIVRTVIHPGQQPTEAQIREIELAASMPAVPDEDAPELTLEQYAEMAAIARNRRSQRVKPVVALRISPETLEKAKATGKGYTGFLSRLLDNAINDPQMVSSLLRKKARYENSMRACRHFVDTLSWRVKPDVVRAGKSEESSASSSDALTDIRSGR